MTSHAMRCENRKIEKQRREVWADKSAQKNVTLTLSNFATFLQSLWAHHFSSFRLS
jgi:hypothetical protein